MSVGLWNSFADEAIAPTVYLDASYRTVELCHGTGVLDGNCIKLDDIPPFGFVFMDLKQ